LCPGHPPPDGGVLYGDSGVELSVSPVILEVSACVCFLAVGAAFSFLHETVKRPEKQARASQFCKNDFSYQKFNDQEFLIKKKTFSFGKIGYYFVLKGLV